MLKKWELLHDHDKYNQCSVTCQILFLFILFPTLNILICLVTPNHHLKWNTIHKHLPSRHLTSSFLLYLLLLFKFNFRKHLQLYFAGKIVSNHRFLTTKFIVTMKLERVDVIVNEHWMSQFLLEKSVETSQSIEVLEGTWEAVFWQIFIGHLFCAQYCVNTKI